MDLPLNVFFSHINLYIPVPEGVAARGGGDSMLTRPGLGNDPLFPILLAQ